jgi:hypothetical protein
VVTDVPARRAHVVGPHVEPARRDTAPEEPADRRRLVELDDEVRIADHHERPVDVGVGTT